MGRKKSSLRQDLFTVVAEEIGAYVVAWLLGLAVLAGLRWLLTSGED